MDPSPFKRAAVVLLVIAIAITSATVAWALATTQAGGVVVVMIGVSPSEQKDASTVEACAKTAIHKAMEEGAMINIAPIGGPSEVAFTSVDTHLRFIERTNPHTARGRQSEILAKAHAALRGLLKAPPPARSSDELSATAMAGRLLASASGPKTLYVCGDGHQVGNGVNFYQRTLDANDRVALTALLRPSLPNLTDVDVVFGAAGLDRKGNPGLQREQRIALWWTIDWKRATCAHTVTYTAIAKPAL